MTLPRRRLLQLALAGATGLWLPPSGRAQTRADGYPFALGVASGSPTASGVVLWTRLMDGDARRPWPRPGPVAVGWEVAHDAQFRQVVRSGQAVADGALAHAVHVEVDGLSPDRWYHYRFLLGDAVSTVGRTRTLPAPDAQVARWRLAYASCQKWEDGYFSAWRHLVEDAPDAVLFLGDYLYEYPGTTSRIRQPGGGWVIGLEDYRRRYALYKSDADLQAIHAACPWLLCWDDHEVQNDYAGVHPGNSGPRDPSDPAAFLARRTAAYQAYYEHQPLPAAVLARALMGLSTSFDGLRMHARVDLGRLASLHLLDDRQYRDPQACTRGGGPGSGIVEPERCPDWNDPRRTLLGAAQERWLAQSLAGPDTLERTWSVLGQQTLFGRRDLRLGSGEAYFNDGWDGYPAARGRLVDTLRRTRAPNPVLLGGDVHANWVGQVKADYADPASTSVGVEFCGTSITSHGGGNARMAERLAENPHYLFADAQEHGYGVADFTPERLQVRLRVVDDVARRDTRIGTLAAFEVRAGRTRVERSG